MTAPRPDSVPSTPRAGAVPRAETVRVTAPDLLRRAALERTRSRLVLAAGGFTVLFGAVAIKLALATVIMPLPAKRLEQSLLPPPSANILPVTDTGDAAPHVRATITDRNGDILAISLPTASLYADPRQIMDPASAAHHLKTVIPDLDEDLIRARLASSKRFVYVARQITPRQEIAINALGIPGIYFQPTERRSYPEGRVAAQVLGGVDVDDNGVAGVEKYFDKRLRDDPTPLRLSLDVRVQAILRDELSKSMDEFQAVGAAGIVMDVDTGEVLAMVSLPDYDANQFGDAKPDDRFNRCVEGVYEPGSTFKLQTASMALDGGIIHIWDSFDALHPIHIGRFTITDFEGKHRFLELPEVLAYSSNLGAAHIALDVGAERQRAWLRMMGMFSRTKIQLPERAMPIYQPEARWGISTVMTVGFGHGIAVSPLHVVDGTAAVANGGILVKPTLIAHLPGDPPIEGVRVMKKSTSDIMRKLMRLVVTSGFGKPADIPGYFVGGKTGTAEVATRHGYRKHTNISAFMSVFPMNAPRYAVYFMLDEPHGNKSTGGFSTAGAVSAPGAGRVIARIGPMLGLLPHIVDEAAIQASLDIPLKPARPPGAPLVAAAPTSMPREHKLPIHQVAARRAVAPDTRVAAQ